MGLASQQQTERGRGTHYEPLSYPGGIMAIKRSLCACGRGRSAIWSRGTQPHRALDPNSASQVGARQRTRRGREDLGGAHGQRATSMCGDEKPGLEHVSSLTCGVPLPPLNRIGDAKKEFWMRENLKTFDTKNQHRKLWTNEPSSHQANFTGAQSARCLSRSNDAPLTR